jgi:hypothetical protein
LIKKHVKSLPKKTPNQKNNSPKIFFGVSNHVKSLPKKKPLIGTKTLPPKKFSKICSFLVIETLFLVVILGCFVTEKKKKTFLGKMVIVKIP